MICCGDETLRDAIVEHWREAPPMFLLEEIFSPVAVNGHGDSDAISDVGPNVNVNDAPRPLADSDPVTIIYTSGTSGEAKGVILSAGNLNYMLRCTAGRLELLMGSQEGEDRVFHYLPFCFAGSWILLLTCLSRNSLLTISTDLSKLDDELRMAAPNYFLNVPALLERMRAGIESQFRQWGGARQKFFEKGKGSESPSGGPSPSGPRGMGMP